LKPSEATLFEYNKIEHLPRISTNCFQQELIRRWDSERELLRSAPRKLPEFDEITQNNGSTPFKVIQGHQFWYQSKAHTRFSISD